MWNEVIIGEKGATNFITGSGGFLQTILNGYAGIQMFIDRLQITNPRLPFKADKLSVSGETKLNKFFSFLHSEHKKCDEILNFQGVKYLGSSFEINISETGSYVRCIQFNAKIPLQIVYSNGTAFTIDNESKCKCLSRSYKIARFFFH